MVKPSYKQYEPSKIYEQEDYIHENTILEAKNNLFNFYKVLFLSFFHYIMLKDNDYKYSFVQHYFEKRFDKGKEAIPAIDTLQKFKQVKLLPQLQK